MYAIFRCIRFLNVFDFWMYSIFGCTYSIYGRRYSIFGRRYLIFGCRYSIFLDVFDFWTYSIFGCIRLLDVFDFWMYSILDVFDFWMYLIFGCKGCCIKKRTGFLSNEFLICQPILIQSVAFFSWESVNFKMVKHVFLRWVVPEIWFDMSQYHFWEFHEFVNFSEYACKIHKSSKTPNFFHKHISGTTQRRKTCFTILKFTYSQLKNATLWIKIGWEFASKFDENLSSLFFATPSSSLNKR